MPELQIIGGPHDHADRNFALFFLTSPGADSYLFEPKRFGRG